MASELARNGGQKTDLLSAIRTRIQDQDEVLLRPHEAVLILEWAVECEDTRCKAELLRLFGVCGGIDLLREAFGIAK